MDKKKYNVPIWEKPFLTLDEANEYFHIGRAKLMQITNEDDSLSFYVGNRKMIKRERMLAFLDQSTSV